MYLSIFFFTMNTIESNFRIMVSSLAWIFYTKCYCIPKKNYLLTHQSWIFQIYILQFLRQTQKSVTKTRCPVWWQCAHLKVTFYNSSGCCQKQSHGKFWCGISQNIRCIAHRNVSFLTLLDIHMLKTDRHCGNNLEWWACKKNVPVTVCN